MKVRIYFCWVLCAVLIALTGCSEFKNISLNPYKHLERAEKLEQQGKIDDAIHEYRLHIEARLESKNRPAWENPYFYMLKIGDLELKRGNVEQALQAYEVAEKKGVDAALVNDRYRQVSRWYEDQGLYAEAMDILKRYRDRDPVLFDAVLDRLAKRLTQIEDQNRQY